MNTWNINKLKEILNIKKCNVEDIEFDYLRIVDLNQVKYEKTAKNTLFFMTYSLDKDVLDGFLIKGFDLRKKANDIINDNPNFTFVVDMDTYEKIINKDANLIVVDNILDSIDKLYKYVLDNRSFKVVAVTGSVGKTTTVGLIESVLKKKYNVLRIYSKRITPIVLKANVINFLTNDIDYVTLEMSIYHKEHVQILSDMLHPDIAALIDIDSSHLEYFNSLEDICIWKSSIFRYAKYGYINNEDNIVNRLVLDDKKLYYDNEFIYDTDLEELNDIVTEYSINGENLVIDNNEIDLFFLSELSIVQVMLSYKIGIKCGVDIKDIVAAISSYVPVENRVQKRVSFGKTIIFDGDVTTNERIKQLANNKYKKSYLVIRKFGSAENNKRFEGVLDYLDKFEKVYIFDDIEYLDMLSKHKNVEVVSNHNFIKDLDGVIIYHYSGYFRVYNEFSEDNLNILDNEVYKIMKPEAI